MNTKTIAILDDEEDIVELISVNLKKNGYTPYGFFEPKKFFNFIKKNTPNLIILDIMLPLTDGYEICKELRANDAWKNIPIIMLSAKSDETDKVLGLELGADDYLTKPFSVKELITRVKVILKRYTKTVEDNIKHIDENIVVINDNVVFDTNKYKLFVDKKSIDLTNVELKILQLLSSRKEYVFSRNAILEYLWSNEKAVVDRTVDVHIRHLREKLGKYANLIKNIRGVGYMLSYEK